MSLRKRLVWVCEQQDLSDIVPVATSLSRILGKMKRRRQIYETRIQMGDFVGEAGKVVSLYKMYAPAHDRALAKVMKAYGWPEAETPPNIESVGTGEDKDKVKPDAVTIFPNPRLWEVDMDTEREEEILKKVKAYRTQKRLVLWVCPTETRRQKLIGWTKDIHDKSFFALWCDLVTNPHGEVWLSGGGKWKALSFVQRDVIGGVGNDVATV